LGGQQVGGGAGTATGNLPHALLWSGTAESVVDLHPFLAGLPINFTESNAAAIASDGSIVGTAGDGISTYAVLWTPVPEPSTAVCLACGLAIASMVCWKRHRSVLSK
jgi:hypothetical protein